jgi:hypothetical protein
MYLKAKDLIKYLEEYPEYNITIDEVFNIDVEIVESDEVINICKED